MPTNNRIFENMFKERIQNTILETTVMEDGIEHTYFLTYIKDLDRLPDTDQDYVAECLDNVTNETMRIELRDVVTFRESDRYLKDSKAETAFVSERIKRQQDRYKAETDRLDDEESHHDECISECIRCMPISEDIDHDTAKNILRDYYICKQSVGDDYYLEWYYKKYFDINVREIETKLNELKSVWLEQIHYHKNKAIKQLECQIDSVDTEEEKVAIEEILALVKDLDVSDTINNFETVEDLITYWPPILLPAPVYVKGPGVPLYFE